MGGVAYLAHHRSGDSPLLHRERTNENRVQKEKQSLQSFTVLPGVITQIGEQRLGNTA